MGTVIWQSEFSARQSERHGRSGRCADRERRGALGYATRSSLGDARPGDLVEFSQYAPVPSTMAETIMARMGM